MATISNAAAKVILTRLGFRVNTSARYRQALRDYQAAYNLGGALKIDGILGDHTSYALAKSESNRKAGKGTLSAHFSFSEFACHCGGRYSSCRRINGEGDAGKTGPDRHVLRFLVQSLEVLRDKEYGGHMTIVSGYRCPGHNKAVGGASASQHMFGGAADLEPKATTTEVRHLKRFAGIGYNPHNLVRHVDRRDTTGHNTTRGSLASPTVWKYTS
jgi:hypothetical protein